MLQLDELNEHRKNNQNCNVSIVTDGIKISAHKAVLSQASPYFRNMFNTDMVEANMDEISIPGIDHQTMELVIGDMYGDSVELTEDNAQSILLAANYMQLTDLVDRCGRFIIDQVDRTNCLSMKILLKSTNSDKKLIERTDEYINAYFVQLSKTEAFLELDIDDVTDILSSDNLNVDSEMDVCDGAIRWMEWKKEREEYWDRIMKCIRLTLVSDTYLAEKFENYPNMIQDTDQDRQQKPRECHNRPCHIIRNATHYEERTYKERLLYVFDTLANDWKVWKKTELGFYHAGKACHKRDIYLIGATIEGNKDLHSFGKMDCDTGIYTPLPRYPNPWTTLIREPFIIGNKFYVPDTERFWYLKIFDIKKNEWRKGPPRNGKDSDNLAIAAVDKYIYVLCADSLTCERFDTDAMKWEFIAPMLKEKTYPPAVGYKGKLYVAGGSSMEVYDPATDQWTVLSTDNPRCDGRTLVATFDGVYSMSQFAQIEHYNVEKGEWSKLAENGDYLNHENNSVFTVPIGPHEL